MNEACCRSQLGAVRPLAPQNRAAFISGAGVRVMDHFVTSENVKRFKRQLSDCTDERQRETLEKLLAEAESHLAQLEHRPTENLRPKH